MAAKIFKLSPSGSTPTAEALNQALTKFRRSAINGDVVRTFIFVFTDGIPDSKSDVERVIVEQTRFMQKNGIDDNMLTILFVQVGDDRAAAAELDRLDNALRSKCNGYDIVDTKNVSAIGSKPITKIVLEAIDG